jgi:hypothetical protein
LAAAVQAEEEEPAEEVELEESTSAVVEATEDRREEEKAWPDPCWCSGLQSSQKLMSNTGTGSQKLVLHQSW